MLEAARRNFGGSADELLQEGARALGDATDSNGSSTSGMVSSSGAASTGPHNGSLESISPGVRLALSRLIAWSPHALCVADATAKDQPIVFANDNFFGEYIFISARAI